MNRYYLWASVRGALASTVALFVILVSFVFLIPVTPENGGEHIWGAGLLMGLLPVVLFVLLFYYLIIGLKKNRSFKFALLMQSIFIIPLSAIVFHSAPPGAGFLMELLNAFYAFILFSVAGVFGAWAWSTSKTHNNGN